MIIAKNVSLTYKDGTMALKPFDLEIRKGDVVFISGPSGSGKTSLLKLIMGRVYPTTGEMIVLGEPMRAQNRNGIRKTRCQTGPVFQEFRLLQGRSVYDNVLLGLRFLNLSNHQMKERAIESIQNVGLEHKTHHSVDRLSWGECQRVAIARAVARKPHLIVADEPTGNLDDQNAARILDLLISFRTEETSVVITTHARHLLSENQKGTFMTMNAGVFTLERR